MNLEELTCRLHLVKVYTTRLVQGLGTEGLVTQEHSKGDRRFKEIKLTLKGRKLLERSSARAFATH